MVLKGVEQIMQVFLSWSKEQSRMVARALHEWLPKVIPAVNPWISQLDIEKGTAWFGELSNALVKSEDCIVCITRQNLRSPYLYYEAGAIAGKLDIRIHPFLLQIGAASIKDGPLSQFMATLDTEEDIKLLVESMNERCVDGRLPDETLQSNFRDAWPTLQSKLEALAQTKYEAEDFIETEADEVAGGRLTPEARELLLAAGRDKHGKIIVQSTNMGTRLFADNSTFAKGGHGREQATWVGALNELLEFELISSDGYTNEIFSVTRDGYKVIDALTDSR